MMHAPLAKGNADAWASIVAKAIAPSSATAPGQSPTQRVRHATVAESLLHAGTADERSTALRRHVQALTPEQTQDLVCMLAEDLLAATHHQQMLQSINSLLSMRHGESTDGTSPTSVSAIASTPTSDLGNSQALLPQILFGNASDDVATPPGRQKWACSDDDPLRTPFRSAVEDTDSFVLSHSAVLRQDDDGNQTVNGYTLWDVVGTGAAGTVYMAFHEENDTETCAVKVLSRGGLKADQRFAEGLLSEVALMKKMRHPNIVQLLECIDDPEADAVYLVMQYVPDGPIVKLSDSGTCAALPLSDVAVCVKQLVSALYYMHHKKGVCHGDIKPDNILVKRSHDGGEPKAFFADFGVSRAFLSSVAVAGFEASGVHDSRDLSFCGDESRVSDGTASPRNATNHHGLGTPAFLSPEVFEGAEPSYAADMWAMGVTLHVMIFGRLPFPGSAYCAIKQRVLHDALVLDIPEDCSRAHRRWCRVIEKLLEKDPRKRLTAKQLDVAMASLVRASQPDPEGAMGSPFNPAPSALDKSLFGTDMQSAMTKFSLHPTSSSPACAQFDITDADRHAALQPVTTKGFKTRNLPAGY
jgi:serine/threonine protein kinase